MALTYTNYNWSLPKLDTSYDCRVSDISNRLTSGNYVASKMTQVLVHPRPDSETTANAICKNAYTGIPYRLPVTVQGGCAPYWFTLVDAPTGMTIGEIHSDTDYGIVEWTNPTAGTHDVVVRCIDQELNAVTSRWTLTVGTDNFVFVDGVSGNDGTGTGLIGAPYQTLGGLFGTTTHGGKIAILRSGATQTTYNHPDVNTNLGAADKPNAIMGHYGDATKPIIDQDTHKFIAIDGSDPAVCNIDFQNSPGDNSGVKDSRFISSSTSSAINRFVFFELDFSGMVRGDTVNFPGTYGGDNPGAITLLNPGSMRQYGTFHSLTIDDFKASMIDMFNVQYWTIENCTLSNSTDTGFQGILIKSDAQDGSIRYTDGIVAQDHNFGVIEILGQEQTYVLDRIEVCYCKIKQTAQRAFTMNNAAANQSSAVEYWAYRNTIQDTIFGGDYNYTFNWEKNVIINDDTPKIPTSGVNSVIVTTDNAEYATTDGAVDVNMDLTGTARTTYLGTHGAEIV